MTPSDLSPQAPRAADPGPAGGKRQFLLISLAVLVLDQWSKWLVESHLTTYASIEIVPGLLNFTHVRNTGVAFGLFAANGSTVGTWVLSALGLLALAFVGYYYRQVPRSERLLLVALAMVLGGAIGNLLDRVLSGGVTDFVDFYVGRYHWHTFNVADSAISVGIALMILTSFRRGERQTEPAEAAGAR